MTEPSDRPGWVPARPNAPTPPHASVDWGTTTIAACSFLFHFGGLCALYSDWTDPPFDDDIVVRSLVEAARELPTLPEVEESPEPASAPKPETAAAAVNGAPRSTGEKGALPRSGPTGAGRSPTPSATELSAELGRLDAAMLAALRTSGPSTDRVLSTSVVPFQDLDVASGRAVATRFGLDLEGGSRIGGYARADGLADLGNRSGSMIPDSRGHAAPTKAMLPGPSLCSETKGKLCGTEPVQSDVPDAPKVIASLQGQFRRCYQKGLDGEDATMAGSVRVTAKIGPNGEVVSTSTAIGGTVSSTVAACIASRVAGAQFSPPRNGQGAVLLVPVALKSQ